MELKPYRLEIYGPDPTAAENMALFESSSPFPSIAVGDFINPAVWEHHYAQSFQDRGWESLLVVNVVHLIGPRGGEEISCTLHIYTGLVQDTAETRTGVKTSTAKRKLMICECCEEAKPSVRDRNLTHVNAAKIVLVSICNDRDEKIHKPALRDAPIPRLGQAPGVLRLIGLSQ
jgi:hypothetical protein